MVCLKHHNYLESTNNNDDSDNSEFLYKDTTISWREQTPNNKTEQLLRDTLNNDKISDDIKSDLLLVEALKHERQLLDHDSDLRGTKSIDFGYLIKDVELKLVQNIKSSLRNKSGNHGHISKNVCPQIHPEGLSSRRIKLF